VAYTSVMAQPRHNIDDAIKKKTHNEWFWRISYTITKSY